MSRTNIVLVVVLIVVVIIVIAFVGGSDEPGNGLEIEENNDPVGSVKTYDPTPPDENLELTEPEEEVKASPGVEAKQRTFDMTILDSGYNPNQIVVNQNDDLRINLSASGGTYDIYIPDLGLYQKVSDGEKKLLAVQTTNPGTYTFFCRDFCPDNEISGKLVVKRVE